MKIKRILRFYFFVDGLEQSFKNLIEANALNALADGYAAADKILGLIEKKKCLGELWGYLNGVMSSLGEGDVATLFNYASRRAGFKNMTREEVNEIKRALIKFTRRAKRLPFFSEALLLVNEYRCLIPTCA